MSRTIPFHFVDVFAVAPLTGNSLAVVDGGGELALELMQNIAREFNQSETTFVLPATRADADWKLRSFTPKGVEVFGAGGHNTLGAWWWLAAAGRLELGDGPTWFHQQIGDLVYPLAIWQSQGKFEKIIMRQEAPVAGRQLSNLGALATALGLNAEEIADVVPCQVVSTGAAHLLGQSAIAKPSTGFRLMPNSFSTCSRRSAGKAATSSHSIRYSPEPQRMHAFSTRLSAFPRIRQPVRRLVRSPHISLHTVLHSPA